ncbi:MAG: Smr/MutS family protein [Betaproteobacteria bacterium AqS2]|uniref:Smr/MutS family protein n=1 Tax=Candidatus Amphirhobacter heronislandensis TaxID=1732024 RepID=A0A930UGD8_9GAMM|nr:Smr/MutS family protein [Betaproteobacteria bacterium AqS2]
MPEKDRDEESFEELFKKEEGGLSSGDFKDAGGFAIEVPRPVLNRQAMNAELSDQCWRRPSYGENKMRSDLGKKRQAKLDLHGDCLERAFERVDEFLAGCLARGCTLVEIVHGKGKRILGPHVRAWLAKCDHVLFYSEVKGNTGSVLVRLRRFDKNK